MLANKPTCLLAHLHPLCLPSQAVGTHIPVMMASCLPWCLLALQQGLHISGLSYVLSSLRTYCQSYIPRTTLAPPRLVACELPPIGLTDPAVL